MTSPLKREVSNPLLATPTPEPDDAAEYWSEESGSDLEDGDDGDDDGGDGDDGDRGGNADSKSVGAPSGKGSGSSYGGGASGVSSSAEALELWPDEDVTGGFASPLDGGVKGLGRRMRGYSGPALAAAAIVARSNSRLALASALGGDGGGGDGEGGRGDGRGFGSMERPLRLHETAQLQALGLDGRSLFPGAGLGGLGGGSGGAGSDGSGAGWRRGSGGLREDLAAADVQVIQGAKLGGLRDITRLVNFNYVPPVPGNSSASSESPDGAGEGGAAAWQGAPLPAVPMGVALAAAAREGADGYRETFGLKVCNLTWNCNGRLVPPEDLEAWLTKALAEPAPAESVEAAAEAAADDEAEAGEETKEESEKEVKDVKSEEGAGAASGVAVEKAKDEAEDKAEEKDKALSPRRGVRFSTEDGDDSGDGGRGGGDMGDFHPQRRGTRAASPPAKKKGKGSAASRLFARGSEAGGSAFGNAAGSGASGGDGGADPAQPRLVAADVVAIGLQEIIALTASNVVVDSLTDTGAKERTGEWVVNFSAALASISARLQRQEASSFLGQYGYQLVAEAHMVGIALLVFVRSSVQPFVRHVQRGIVPTGKKVGKGKDGESRRLGNKGAVTVRLTVWDTSLCFVSAHLTANTRKWDQRNDNVLDICAAAPFTRDKRLGLVVLREGREAASAAVLHKYAAATTAHGLGGGGGARARSPPRHAPLEGASGLSGPYLTDAEVAACVRRALLEDGHWSRADLAKVTLKEVKPVLVAAGVDWKGRKEVCLAAIASAVKSCAVETIEEKHDGEEYEDGSEVEDEDEDEDEGTHDQAASPPPQPPPPTVIAVAAAAPPVSPVKASSGWFGSRSKAINEGDWNAKKAPPQPLPPPATATSVVTTATATPAAPGTGAAGGTSSAWGGSQRAPLLRADVPAVSPFERMMAKEKKDKDKHGDLDKDGGLDLDGGGLGGGFGLGSGSVLAGDGFEARSAEKAVRKRLDVGERRLDHFGVLDHDVLFFLGDLNYRIDDTQPRMTFEFCHAAINSGRADVLLPADQLNMQRALGNVFRGFEEGPVLWPPSYKFVPFTDVYDRRPKKKKRAPAWCDRILWREGPTAVAAGTSAVRCLMRYEPVAASCPSDHVPVAALFDVEASRTDRAAYRAACSDALAAALAATAAAGAASAARRELERGGDSCLDLGGCGGGGTGVSSVVGSSGSGGAAQSPTPAVRPPPQPPQPPPPPLPPIPLLGSGSGGRCVVPAMPPVLLPPRLCFRPAALFQRVEKLSPGVFLRWTARIVDLTSRAARQPQPTPLPPSAAAGAAARSDGSAAGAGPPPPPVGGGRAVLRFAVDLATVPAWLSVRPLGGWVDLGAPGGCCAELVLTTVLPVSHETLTAHAVGSHLRAVVAVRLGGRTRPLLLAVGVEYREPLKLTLGATPHAAFRALPAKRWSGGSATLDDDGDGGASPDGGGAGAAAGEGSEGGEGGEGGREHTGPPLGGADASEAGRRASFAFFNSSQAAKAQAAKGGRRSMRGAAEKQAEKRAAAAAEASLTKRVEVGEAVVL